MTSTQEKSAGLFSSLKNSPATGRLMEQGKEYLRSRAGGMAGSLGNKVESATQSIGKVGESGSLSAVTEGAKRMSEGDSPVKAAIGTAGTQVKDKVKGLVGKATGKGKGKGGGGKNKSMNIVESIDVGVPVSVAYNQWTQYQEFGRFMKGVENVETTSETEQNWRVKVFKSRRSWKSNVTEQVPDRRIAWSSEGAKGSTEGAVTFHPLADDLTRVVLAMRYYPQGLFEKTGNLWRAGGRRARLDLKNFQTFVTMQGKETGSWRGEIHEGKVTQQPEDEEQGDQAQDQQGDEAEDQQDQGDQAQGQQDQGEKGEQDEGDEQSEDQDGEQSEDRGGAQASSDEDSQDESDESDESDEGAKQPAGKGSRG
jgi:uncharacterized membrane protein